MRNDMCYLNLNRGSRRVNHTKDATLSPTRVQPPHSCCAHSCCWRADAVTHKLLVGGCTLQRCETKHTFGKKRPPSETKRLIRLLAARCSLRCVALPILSGKSIQEISSITMQKSPKGRAVLNNRQRLVKRASALEESRYEVSEGFVFNSFSSAIPVMGSAHPPFGPNPYRS